MTYEQRSELRKECSRFLRFSYLIDFIGLESLRTIYKESVNELLIEFDDLI
jgi:dynein heavy chain